MLIYHKMRAGWVLVLFIILSISIVESAVINIGCIYPLSFEDSDNSNVLQQVVELAVLEINNNKIIPNYDLSVTVRDTQRSERIATEAVYQFLENNNNNSNDTNESMVLGIIGSAFAKTSIAAQRIASLYGTPQLSPATEDILDNKEEYPTFLRLVPPNSVQASVIVKLVQSFKWKKVSVIYTTDSYGIGFWSEFRNAAVDLDIVAHQSIDASASDISYELKLIADAKEDAVILLSLGSNAIPILKEASKHNMLGNGQVWIGSDGVMSLTPSNFAKDDLSYLVDQINGFIGTYPSASGSGYAYERYDSLMTENNISPPLGAMSFYDACFVYAYALKLMVETNGIPADSLVSFSRSELFAFLTQVSIEGASGTLSFNAKGNVDMDYDILNWQDSNGFAVLGKWNGGSSPAVIFSVHKDDKGISKVGLAFAIILPVIALAILAYGVKMYIDRERVLLLAESWNDDIFDEVSFWEESLNLEVGGLAVDKKQLSFGLPVDARFPIDTTLKDKITLTNNLNAPVNFKIYAPRNEGKFICKIHPGHGTIPKGESVEIKVQLTLLCTTDVAHFIKIEVPGFENRYTCVQMVFEGEICDKLDPDELEITDTLGKGGFGTVYKGTYRGTVVAVKTMNAQSDWVDPELVSEFQRELALLRKLKHPNVVSFVACSLVPKKLCLAIEYCENGELRSYMKKRQGNLSIALKFRILLDVAKGMSFLHSAGVFHRDIKPDNILLVSDNVESAVVAKINDFGTARALAVHQINQPKFHTKCIGTPVYMAPELYLVQPYNNKVDVYSYGLVMWEVLTEQMPFYFVDKPWDVYNYVIAGKTNPIPTDYPPQVTALIQSCWATNPNDRPTFPDIVHKMEELFKQAQSNKDYMAPTPNRNSSTINLLKALQNVKRRRPFQPMSRAKTMAGGVVVNVELN